MARPRSGLGHGLEALVSSRDWNDPASPSAPPDKTEPAHPLPIPAIQWEVATLVQRGRKGRRLFLSTLRRRASHGLKRRRLRGVSLLAALNALGADGWELVAIEGRRFYLKRPSAISGR